MGLGQTALQIPGVGMTERQTAVLRRVEALKLFYDGDYQASGSLFWTVLTKFSQLGLGQFAQECVPFWAVAKMLVGDRTGIFDAPEIVPFVHTPLVAPFQQLHEAYNRDDVKLFKARIATALAQFSHGKCAPLLEQLRVVVLRRAIMTLCKAFETISTKYIADKLQSTQDEVEGLVQDLILDGTRMRQDGLPERLGGLFDPQKRVLVMMRQAKQPYLEYVPALLSEIEALACTVHTRFKLPLEHRAWP